MPRIIPVLDVLHGRAVHARGGRREDYRLLHSLLRQGSDPVALAAALRDAWRTGELYLADLDAIAGAAPAIGLYQELARLGLATWIDAGLRDATGVKPLLDAGVSRVVVGLETLAGSEFLTRIVEVAGASQVVFSLDLRDGQAIVASGANWETVDPRQIARRAVEAGYATIIILDLGRVGTGRGVGTLDLLRDMVTKYPRVEWVVGGGVSGNADVEALWRAGAAAVLVGSAIHDGRMTVTTSDPAPGSSPTAD
ncbi:MAG TPA: HisA/HisF-related TIM barrel protein [Isosphaeraceae bacterium]